MTVVELFLFSSLVRAGIPITDIRAMSTEEKQAVLASVMVERGMGLDWPTAFTQLDRMHRPAPEPVEERPQTVDEAVEMMKERAAAPASSAVVSDWIGRNFNKQAG